MRYHHQRHGAMLAAMLANERQRAHPRCDALVIDSFMPTPPSESLPTAMAIAVPPPPAYLLNTSSEHHGITTQHVPAATDAVTPVVAADMEPPRVQQLGVSLVLQQPSRCSHEAGTLVLRLQNGAVDKLVTCTHTDFQQLMARLRAMFPGQLASRCLHSKKMRTWKKDRLYVNAAQDVLHNMRQLVMIPVVLTSALFHRFVKFTANEAVLITELVNQMRDAEAHAARVHKLAAIEREYAAHVASLLEQEAERSAQLQHHADFEMAEMVCAKYFLGTRYECGESLQLPLLTFDHDMPLTIHAPKKLSHRSRVVTGPGGHKFFRAWRKGHFMYLSDMFSNDLAQIDLAPRQLPLILQTNVKFSVIRRAFPACQRHQPQQPTFDLLPSFVVSSDSRRPDPSERFSIHALPTASSVTNLGSISVGAKSSTTKILRLTTRNDDGFKFFLGDLSHDGDATQLLVHPGQDVITVLMLALTVDAHMDSKRR